MVFSEEHKYVFIEVAKTASTSLKRFLLEQDSSSKENIIISKDNEYIKVNTHVTAKQLKKIMGDYYDNYTIIGFVRHPFSKIVSNYHFYKNGRAYKNFKNRRL